MDLNSQFDFFNLCILRAKPEVSINLKRILNSLDFSLNSKWCGFFAFLQKAQNDKGFVIFELFSLVILSATKYPQNSKPCFWCCVFEFLLLQQLVFKFVLVKFGVKVFANALRVFFSIS